MAHDAAKLRELLERGRAHNLTGLRFGRLTAVSPHSVSASKSWNWLCQCDCGNEKVVRAGNLKRDQVQSCGCLIPDRVREVHQRHGGSPRGERAPEYIAWKSIKQRCLDTGHHSYPLYGGRGITVCDSWRDDFAAFAASVGKRPTKAHSIDRIDNSKGYEPGNCRWATTKEQGRNRRTNVAIERSDGLRFGSLIEAAESAGVHPSTLSEAASSGRICRGFRWSRALISQAEGEAKHGPRA